MVLQSWGVVHLVQRLPSVLKPHPVLQKAGMVACAYWQCQFSEGGNENIKTQAHPR